MEIFLLAVLYNSCTDRLNTAIKIPGSVLPLWPHDKCHENIDISIHYIAGENTNLPVICSNDVARAYSFSIRFALLGSISQLANQQQSLREGRFFFFLSLKHISRSLGGLRKLNIHSCWGTEKGGRRIEANVYLSYF